MRHLKDDELTARVSGEGPMSGDEHLRVCSLCAGRLETWREMLSGLKELEAHGIDDGERHLLRTMLRTSGGHRRAPGVVARLLRSTALAPVGVRGPAARLWEWEAGELRLTLQARDEPGGFRLLGQVTASGVPSGAGRLTLHGEAGEVIEDVTDELGEFAVRVNPGRYRLELESPEQGLVVPLVDVREGVD